MSADQTSAGHRARWGAGTFWLASRWFRRRIVAMVPTTLLMLAGTTGTMVSLAAAERTSTAYRDYLEHAAVGDVVINPSIKTREIDEVIRSLPNVERITTDSLFSVTYDEGAPRPRGEIDEDESSIVFVRGSHDGRYTDMDRPAVNEGRMPTGPNEAVVTVETARAEALAIGDIVPLAFWQPEFDDPITPDIEAHLREVIAPIGVEHLEIVGIVTLADEVLPDDLYPRQRLIVSPDIAARYDCLPPSPEPGSTRAEVAASLLPADCAASYRYYSLALADGADGVKPALDEFLRRSRPMNQELAQISDQPDGADPPQYFLIPVESELQTQQVELAIRPTVAALVVLGLAAAGITVALVGFAVARELRHAQRNQRQWHQFGVGTAARAVVSGAPSAVAVLSGVLLGIVGGWLLDRGPVGLVRAIEPNPARELSAIAVMAAGGLAIVTVVLVGVLATRSARRPDLPSVSAAVRGRTLRRVAARSSSPALADGIRAAYGQRATIPVIAGGVLLTSAVVAAAVFGISLSSLVSTPRSYGWPWDAGAMTGSGYGDLDHEVAQAAFDADPDISSWSALGFINEVTLNGEPMVSLVGFERTTEVDLPVLAGELPRGWDEVAIGAATAADRDIDVGDTVEIAGAFEPQMVTVTGIVVFPTLGPILADRVGVGSGMLLTEALLSEALAESGFEVYAEASITDLAAFVGVNLRDGSDTPQKRAELEATFIELDSLGSYVFQYPSAVRPPEIIDARSARTVPLAVGAALAAVTAIGLAFASWSSVRARRRELAVLRALGFSNAQVRLSVRVQSLATMLGALAIGVPVGVIGGRVLWRAFASELGVVPDPAGAWTAVAAIAVAGIVVAVVAAQVPAYIASRSAPAEGLRAE